MTPSVWERGCPRPTGVRRNGWQPAGCRQGSNSCETRRPEQQTKQSRVWMILRGRTPFSLCYLFISRSGKESEAGDLEEALLLVLTQNKCALERDVRTFVNEMYAGAWPGGHRPRSWWPACSAVSWREPSRPWGHSERPWRRRRPPIHSPPLAATCKKSCGVTINNSFITKTRKKTKVSLEMKSKFE